MLTKHDFMLQLAGQTDDLVVLKLALKRSLEQHERDGYVVADAHPESAIGVERKLLKALDDAMHGRHTQLCKTHWTKEQYAALCAS